MAQFRSFEDPNIATNQRNTPETQLKKVVARAVAGELRRRCADRETAGRILRVSKNEIDGINTESVHGISLERLLKHLRTLGLDVTIIAGAASNEDNPKIEFVNTLEEVDDNKPNI
jgi:hypothetical protein